MECSREKTNEIAVSKRLIEALKIKNTVITADALLCQKEVCKKIAKDNEYALALKANQPTMEQEVKEFFLCPAEQTRSQITTFDKGHGRLEERIYTLDTNIDWFADKKEWKNLASFGMCERGADGNPPCKKASALRLCRFFYKSEPHPCPLTGHHPK